MQLPLPLRFCQAACPVNSSIYAVASQKFGVVLVRKVDEAAVSGAYGGPELWQDSSNPSFMIMQRLKSAGSQVGVDASCRPGRDEKLCTLS